MWGTWTGCVLSGGRGIPCGRGGGRGRGRGERRGDVWGVWEVCGVDGEGGRETGAGEALVAKRRQLLGGLGVK